MHVGQLLAALSTPAGPVGAFVPELGALHNAIEKLIDGMDGGVAAHFARRLGVTKSTVHHWKSSHSALSMDALVRIAIHCNVPLINLVQGKLQAWCPPSESRQLTLQLDYPPRSAYRPRREHDWLAIRQYLHEELKRSVPRSLTEIAKALDMDERYLYIHATVEARQLGDRYVRHLRERTLNAQVEIHRELGQACATILASGVGVTVEQVGRLVDAKTLNATRNLYTVLSDLAAQATNDDRV
ncbi:helix-turn-helix domain-containing protein [Alcaligenaceae bacterium CGII-47]|nr:helix-turn-helix domain-containing protein [Alcaligenaceae bacterium CGII-47]